MHSAKRLTAFGGIAERFVRDNASLCSRRYRAGANGVRDTALRRPHGVLRLGRKNCSRMAVTLLRRDRVKKAHYGFRLIAERMAGVYESTTRRDRRPRRSENVENESRSGAP